MTQVKLTVELINKTISRQTGRVVSKKLSGNCYAYYGKTKKEANDKAKNAGRFGASYAKEYSTELVED